MAEPAPSASVQTETKQDEGKKKQKETTGQTNYVAYTTHFHKVHMHLLTHCYEDEMAVRNYFWNCGWAGQSVVINSQVAMMELDYPMDTTTIKQKMEELLPRERRIALFTSEDHRKATQVYRITTEEVMFIKGMCEGDYLSEVVVEEEKPEEEAKQVDYEQVQGGDDDDSEASIITITTSSINKINERTNEKLL